MNEAADEVEATGKLRLDRGPLRWWLVVTGLLVGTFEPLRWSIGVSLVVVGMALHFCVKCYLVRNWALTKSGPYRFTRNPYYLFGLIAELGLLVLIGRWWIAVPYLVLWAWIYRSKILAEEANLLALFGDEYADYCRAVPRFLPSPWRVFPKSTNEPDGPRFSWRNPSIVGGREVERTIRFLSYPVLIYVAAVARDQGWTAFESLTSSGVLAAGGFVLLNALGRVSSVVLRSRRLISADGRRATKRELAGISIDSDLPERVKRVAHLRRPRMSLRFRRDAEPRGAGPTDPHTSAASTEH